MPPKVRITKEEIIDTALEMLRENGDGGINARSIASRLGCSTQPIFSNFASMEDLDKAVSKAAYDLYLSFLQREAESGKYPKYKAFGMAYISFAKEERELFKHLFMRDRRGEGISPTLDFEESVEMIMKANGVSEEKARLMHTEMWTFVHGIGTMLATSFLELEWELISDMLTDVYRGIQIRHTGEEK